MTKNLKILIGVLVAILIIGGIWFATKNNNSSYMANQTNFNPMATATNSNANTDQTAAANPATNTDSTNAGLNSDLNNIDTQMNGLTNDSSKMDQSANPQ